MKYRFDDDEVEEARETSGDIQVRRLPLVNRNTRLVGIIAIGDIGEEGIPRP